jgi:UDP-glucose 4-epimerase
MAKILVTGGAGAIGSRLAYVLCKEHDVLVLDDLSSGWFDKLHGLPIRFWRGSVTDEEILKEVFAERPSVVFHLAANFANQNSVDYPQKDLAVNGRGTLNLLQHALESGVGRFIYTSSSCVYGNISESISESMDRYSLDTPYSITKLLGERYVNFFHQHHSMPTVIIRFFNSYGPGEYPGKYRNVIPNFFNDALNNKPLVITGNGKETRDFTFIDDSVQGLVLAMSKPEAEGKTFNVGSGIETPIGELAKSIRDICNVDVPIEYKPKREWDSVTRRCADISYINNTLGYLPKTDLKAGLRKTYEWFIENNVYRFHLI